LISPGSSGNLFSKQAAEYAKYRPRYPRELFEFLASVAPGRHRAWDCATGNGQAAVDLAGYFDEVIATDVSEAQIRNALPHPKVHYSVAPAEKTSLASRSFDLVTVAQAAHWLDHDLFYREARRVLRPKGVVALWCYGHNREVAPPIEAVYQKFAELIKPYWAPQVHYIWEEYKTLPFPFEEIRSPTFSMEAYWDLEAFTGYHWSWSATQKYVEQMGVNPLELIGEELRAAWGPPETRHRVGWRMYLRVGRI
jgi:ubiquinone/menaquinone biosynthesis C-methylase UbiE